MDVIAVHRDASTYAEIPEDTWVLAFGWFMHALFHMRHAFPLHANLRPIFVSFHCNKRDMLTPEAIEYLKRYAPIGCRDWTTVDLLLSLDVPAFFSGCVTTTTDVVLGEPTAPPPADAGPAYVDVPAPDGAASYQHEMEEVRNRPLAANLRTALQLLEAYRARPQVVTSRLHAYLPVRALGVPVDFRPAQPGRHPARGARRHRRRGVRPHARRAGRRDRGGHGRDPRREARGGGLRAVARAHRRRRGRGPRAARPPARAAAGARGDRHAGAPVDRGDEAPRARGRARRPRPRRRLPAGRRRPRRCPCSSPRCCSTPAARCTCTSSRGPAPRRRSGVLAERFPELRFDWIPTRGYAGTIANPDGSRPDAKGLIRLLLPDLLPDVDRVAIFDLPSVALGDVAELDALDLAGTRSPRRRVTDVDATSGFGLLHDAAARLGDRADAATELRRAAHARHAFDFDAFDAHVLVLDLARMRADGFTAQALPLIPAFGLDQLEVLHFLAGPGRAELPERWSAIPTRSPAVDALLLHWADGVSPFQDELTPQRERGVPSRAR